MSRILDPSQQGGNVTAAIDHLRSKSGLTHELLAALTDAELEEKEAYLRERRDRYVSRSDDAPPRNLYASNAYAAYRCDVALGYVDRERRRRETQHLDG